MLKVYNIHESSDGSSLQQLAHIDSKPSGNYPSVSTEYLYTYENTSLVPRPFPAFQCCTLTNGKAWYLKSRV